ncbi:MAG: pyridoxal phosphate-dependent aminotransferase [Myxococcota bacterium]|jgi:aspartate aminotransferase|nr:pyridoxal phosphate-dependent aminotransferase [Myxococcota bacterium]
MQRPQLSAHFASRQPSAIRTAQIEFMKRPDKVDAVNTAIGNVTLPMHPAMRRRMHALGEPGSPFLGGVCEYSTTVGVAECCEAVLHVIASSGLSTAGLKAQMTDGGSAAMELLLLGVCGGAGSTERPLLLIDAAYTNYKALAQRTGRATVSVQRKLGDDGKFSLPDVSTIEATIAEHKPGCLVVIPYDNPTGHYYDHASMVELARLCVKHNLWMASDEAYRELYYVDGPPSSIWRITEAEVPGITGRRISIETASKVWNACGLRIGALVTDNEELHVKAVAEYTANLCTNVIGQYVFGALKHEKFEDLQAWYKQQRAYYSRILTEVKAGLKSSLPGIIVSSPDASIYSVVDVKNIVKPGFDAMEFVLHCARKGKVVIEGKELTLLVSPMAGFYQVGKNEPNPGTTQMRISFVDTAPRMALVPRLFAELLHQFEAGR